MTAAAQQLSEARAQNEAHGLDILRERIRAAAVPRARRDQSLVLATWNIRELGKSSRRPESLVYIAEVLRTFDLCVVIELRENLAEFKSEISRNFWTETSCDYAAT